MSNYKGSAADRARKFAADRHASKFQYHDAEMYEPDEDGSPRQIDRMAPPRGFAVGVFIYFVVFAAFLVWRFW